MNHFGIQGCQYRDVGWNFQVSHRQVGVEGDQVADIDQDGMRHISGKAFDLKMFKNLDDDAAELSDRCCTFLHNRDDVADDLIRLDREEIHMHQTASNRVTLDLAYQGIIRGICALQVDGNEAGASPGYQAR